MCDDNRGANTPRGREGCAGGMREHSRTVLLARRKGAFGMGYSVGARDEESRTLPQLTLAQLGIQGCFSPFPAVFPPIPTAGEGQHVQPGC